MDEALRANVEAQLERLISQLQDLEELRDELDAEEYESTKKETKEQLVEFQESLEKMAAGDMTLQTELDSTRQAVRAAISDAFKTPEVIRLFAGKQRPALRRRLAEMNRDLKLGKLEFAVVSPQAAEILVALKKLGEPLDAKEEEFLAKHKSASLSEFDVVADGDDVVSRLPSAAGAS